MSDVSIAGLANRLAAFWARLYPEKYPLKDIPPTYPPGK